MAISDHRILFKPNLGKVLAIFRLSLAYFDQMSFIRFISESVCHYQTEQLPIIRMIQSSFSAKSERERVQGDHSAFVKPPVDTKTKVAFKYTQYQV